LKYNGQYTLEASLFCPPEGSAGNKVHLYVGYNTASSLTCILHLLIFMSACRELQKMTISFILSCLLSGPTGHTFVKFYIGDFY